MYTAVCARKKFLVISGPSTVGKRYVARSLIPSSALIELNCASATHANLTNFVEGETRLILWDEASAKFLASNRKLVQHAPFEVDMGMTASGMFTKYYFLADAASVVCCNDWKVSLDECDSPEAARWCEANSMVLYVQEPMWDKTSSSSSQLAPVPPS